MTTLRWGVLGAANIARKQVIPAIQASNNGRVVGIASRDKARAEQLAQAASIGHVFDDYAALLASDEIDAVYIPLPNSEHRAWTIAAAEAGKHILCEKPLALTASEAEEMVAAAERAGVILAEAFMYRHHPVVHTVLEMLHQGVIGELRVVRSTFTFNLSNEGDIRLSAPLGGGALMDVGCYGVNLARLVTGAEPLAGCGIADYGSSGVDESFVGALRFAPDGRAAVVAEVDVSVRAAGGTSYELIGTQGKIVVRQGFKPDANEEGEIQLHQHGDVSRIFTDAVDQYRLMVEDFGKSVLLGRPLAYPAQDAVANMRVLDMLRTAAEQARP
ncbi:MAG: Gfo/Idh/MocA family oxidoreductase [Chloroflexota bacterium]|nr:Gfo/Idh/MocA family oxidoreductase [Chloroflexota bacterium]